jgi:hypothetical protein
VSGCDSPCMCALRSKYKVHGGWLFSEPLKNSSATWRALERLKPTIRKGACFTIGDGKSVDVWKDPWVPSLPSFLPRPKAGTVPNNMLVVANLINLETKSWRFGMLEEMFDLESVNAISNIVLPLVPRHDKLIWIDDPKGMFSVKSALKLHQCHLWPENPDPIWRKLWKCKIHERLKTLVWRIGSGAFFQIV